jgi:hypothetical protein
MISAIPTTNATTPTNSNRKFVDSPPSAVVRVVKTPGEKTLPRPGKIVLTRAVAAAEFVALTRLGVENRLYCVWTFSP